MTRYYLPTPELKDHSQTHPYKKGVVKVYKEEAGYGFIKWTGPDLFFHVSTYHRWEIDHHEMSLKRQFAWDRKVDADGKARNIVLMKKTPKAGDSILFNVEDGPRPKASEWVLEEVLHEERHQLLNLYKARLETHLNLPIYKLIEVTLIKGEPRADNKTKRFYTPCQEKRRVIFEGNNVGVLQYLKKRSESTIRGTRNDLSWECYLLNNGKEEKLPYVP
jgi:cold shock CspA family protein